MTHLVTHEIGSMAKPSWRVKAVADRPLDDADLEAARSWGERLQVPNLPRLLALLEKRRGFTDEEKADVKRWASVFGLRLQADAGLDWVFDGEQQRTEMYHYPVQFIEGLEFRGLVRSFDDKYYRKAAAVDHPRAREAYHVAEHDWLAKHADRPVKIPITGPYTLVDWSYDERPGRTPELGTPGGREARREARRELVLDVARDVVRPNVEALADAGAGWIQIDEPAVTTRPDEVDLYVEAFQEATRGVDATFSTHICFSDYDALFPAILELEGCDQFALEFANRDPWTPGTSAHERPGYRVLERFAQHPADVRIGLGVLDVHTDRIEPPELVRDRILHAVDVLGDPARVNPTPDCGLRTRTWEVAHAKLRNLVEGTRLAEEALP